MKLNILFLIIPYICTTAQAQENISFQKPSKEILALADYERTPTVSMDTKKEYMLLSYINTYKSLQDLNQEEMRLGGLRINPITNISSTVTYINNLKIRKLSNKDAVQVSGLPENANITNISWSPNDKKIAFTNTIKTGVALWVIDVATATATKLTETNVNANFGSPYSWMNDNETLLVKMLPKNKPNLINSKSELPNGPTISSSTGSVSQNRTYADLLKNKTDETNFEILLTAELQKVSLQGNTSLFKDANLYINQSISPDGNYVMLTTIEKPFSYIVPLGRFPQKTIVYDLAGNEVKQVNQVPLIEVMPKGFSSVRKGKRGMAWRADKPATLVYAIALDEGDQAVKADYRDELFLWNAPFNDAPTSFMKTQQRFSGILWGNDNVALAYDDWYDTRNTKTYLINPANPSVAPIIIFDRNAQDIYADPGDFETKKNNYNRYVLDIDNNNTTYLIGAGHTKTGQFPFIDAYNLTTRKTKRLYTSTYKDKKESLLSIENAKTGDVLVLIESKTDYPNYFIRNIKSKNKLTQLTFFNNPFESIKNVYKEVIQYKRKDGVALSGTLYLPANYDRNKKGKLPLLIWAYPTEFKDKNSAGQTDKNPNEFTFPSYGSFIYWVTKGYAVLDDASFPIIGEGETEPNDNFMDQLIANAEAAINAVDTLGYINRKKVAIGGHSYGAFMTANLLTHSKLFACGIARSGAYNRTLTPFGFQLEQRNYWDVPKVYNDMSPFMNAEKMKTPLLLVHGDADNNPGTFTLQSERYFQALKGLGAPVRLVLLPKEAHGYAAKENILHLLWEQDIFLEKYLKN
jgi:dipeptidyl aminopeptidase/acylaminoacyl peptidase